MDLATQRLMAAAGGGGKNPGDNIDTFFHTAVWDGDGSGTTIYAGVDWFGSGKEALFMIKDRDGAQGSWWYDSVRGDRKGLQSYDSAAETNNISSGAWDIYDINSSNATFKTGGNYNWVPGSGPMKAHCFRTGSGFFDIVTWTGNATDNRAIAHNLQCKPGAIFIKCRNRSEDWRVWHKAYGNTKSARLNARNRFSTSSNTNYWGSNNTEPTSTHFTIGPGDGVNYNGKNFIAYVFADGDDADAQIFGREGDASLIKCGSFTQTGSTVEVDIGWEPQFVIFKTNANSDSSTTWGNWYVMDSTTGFAPYRQNRTKLSQTGAESDYSSQNISENDDILYPYARGFRANMAAGSSPDHYTNEPIEYIAIRRPDAVVGYKGLTGEQYFDVSVGTGSASRENAGFQVQFDKRVVDLAIIKKLDTSDHWKLTSRQVMNGYFQGVNRIYGRGGDNEWGMDFDGRNETDGFIDSGGNWNQWWGFMWCRDAGLSTQYYVGTGTGKWVYHDLYQEPGMIWYKKVNSNSTWTVWHMGLNEGNPEGRHISLTVNATEQNDNAYFDGAPADEHRHRVKGSSNTGASGDKYVAYFFGNGVARGSGDYGADGAAISKCGYYTGSSSNQTITLGFAPRLWISKRVDGSGGGGHWNLASKDANNSRGHGDWQYDYWLDDNGNQATGSVTSANSTSITLSGGGASNTNSGKYIYYAHS